MLLDFGGNSGYTKGNQTEKREDFTMKTFWKVLIVLVAVAAAGTAAYLWLRAKKERCICGNCAFFA